MSGRVYVWDKATDSTTIYILVRTVYRLDLPQGSATVTLVDYGDADI
jgi:hypothetical protein